MARKSSSTRTANPKFVGSRWLRLEQLDDRLAPAGGLDPSFDFDGKVTTEMGAGSFDSVRALVIQNDGKIVVGGTSSYAYNSGDFALARYNPDGTLDSTFGVGGKIRTDFTGGADGILAIAVQPDGKILVTGQVGATLSDLAYELPFSSGVAIPVIRYNADGSLDSSFGPGGIAWIDLLGDREMATGIEVLPDGKILVTGSRLEHIFTARLNGNGTLDATYGTGGTTIQPNLEYAYGMARQPDGKVIVVGQSFDVVPAGSFGVTRFNANGSLDTSFDGDGHVSTGFPNISVAIAAVVQPDGKIIVGGNFNNSGGGVLVRYNPSGSLDTSFGNGGVFVASGALMRSIQDLVLQPDGKLLVVGTALTGWADAGFVARFNTNGTLDTTFDGDGYILPVPANPSAPGSEFFAVGIQGDGRVVAAGYHSVANSVTRQDFFVARLLPDPFAVPDVGTLFANGSKTLAVLSNDYDLNPNNTLSIQSATTPAHGQRTINANGTITYTPTPGYVGLDSFNYTIVNNEGTTSTSTVSLVVKALAITGAPANSPEGTAISLGNSITNDGAAESHTFAWSVTKDGNAYASGTGSTFSFTPNDNASYVVTLTATDGDGDSGSASATIVVNNLAPTAVDDSAVTSEDQLVSMAVLGNDSDPVGGFDPLQIVSVTNGSKGTTAIDTKGTAVTTDDEIVYTPHAGAFGSDSFTYTIGDGDGGSATATVNVQIRNLVDVSGRVFDDLDNDGVYEPGDGEVGIGGVSVQLFDETSNTLIATRTTAADGTYFFDVNLISCKYKVVAAQPIGFLDGKDTAGNLGGTIDNSQDSNLIGGISVGDPGTTADAIDYLFAEIRPSQAQGLVWLDGDNDGQVDFGETAVAGTTIELAGVDDRGNAVNRNTTTDANGIYAFIDLRPSNATGYSIRELQPAGYLDGLDVLGTVNGVMVGNGAVNDTISGVVMSRPGSLAENYNFGERIANEGGVEHGQTATIGYWQNNNGQNLIKALNGGSTATQLGNWLAATFANMYGSLAGKTNAEVAAFYKTLFARNAKSAAGGGPPKMDAQVMATTFAVYVTNQSLAGTTATSYGFLVTANGVGTRTFNLSSNGAAFGVANNTNVTVFDLLLAVNSRSRNGLLYDLDADGDANDAVETSYRTMANNVFSGINEAGDI